MELAEYSQLRNRTYVLRILNKKYWPHHIVVKAPDDAERWCYTKFKSAEWRNVGQYFAFKKQQDAVMFSLRWGS